MRWRYGRRDFFLIRRRGEKMDWKYKRSDFRLPKAQLEHVEMTVRFFEDRVEAEGRLRCRAREAMSEVELDLDGAKKAYALGREYGAGEVFEVEVAHTSHPDDVRLEGIYRDATPEGAPQQYMSQCQQYGFQRIMPIIDDCTAKCTFRTTLEGDARYTHLISNGDVVEDVTEGGRRRVTYENRTPMAPYLFIACAGTWDVVRDEVEYPGGKKVKLEYLVPPGQTEGAKIPMEILKRSILFQHRATGFEYPYETYRTICMERSLYGGMENTGNTTIVTEAALIDGTIGDRRLVYAHGVIPHEFEHSHCGSSVTMESVFDMWLNEAYTVNVERAFLAEEFGEAFARGDELAALRATGGALAEEESGMAGAVVREGVNDPDEVVDAITYDKAPEVLNTLRNLIGEEAYARGWKEYFRKYEGGNANTDDFLDTFGEASGRDVRGLMKPWLYEAGHPTVGAEWKWENGTITVTLQRDKDYTVPVPFALVKGGRDVAAGTFVLDGAKQEFSAKCAEKPDFVSWNRGGGFYGVLEAKAGEAELRMQALEDPCAANRAEAMRMLRDKNASGAWLECYEAAFGDGRLGWGEKAEILSVPADSLDRWRRALVRENAREMHMLRKAAALRIGEARITAALAGAATGGADAEAIVRRAWEARLLELLAELGTESAQAAIYGYLKRAVNITARLNGLKALDASGSARAAGEIAAAGKELRKTLNGYNGYLGVVAAKPREEVFAAMAAEEKRAGWSIKHPGLSRALYCGFAGNADMLWTAKGLEWLERTLVKWAKVSEYNAVRLLAPVGVWRRFEPGLRGEVKALLGRVAEALPREKYAFIGGKLEALLKPMCQVRR